MKLLLESNYFRKKGIDDRDNSGNSAIYTTVKLGFRDGAKLLLSKCADVRIFERSSKIFLSDSLFIVKEILDDCLQHNDKLLTNKDLQLKLKDQSFVNIISRITDSKIYMDLLTHPMISNFLILE